jgi:hypothetical protein
MLDRAAEELSSRAPGDVAVPDRHHEVRVVLDRHDESRSALRLNSPLSSSMFGQTYAIPHAVHNPLTSSLAALACTDARAGGRRLAVATGATRTHPGDGCSRQRQPDDSAYHREEWKA